jgi:hypothetical protein
MTPDEVSYRYTVSWETVRPLKIAGCPDPGFSQYAEVVAFPDFDAGRPRDLHAAMDAHHVAKRGDWVKPGMLRPHVGPLEVWAGGRQIGERLPGKDLDERPVAAVPA